MTNAILRWHEAGLPVSSADDPAAAAALAHAAARRDEALAKAKAVSVRPTLLMPGSRRLGP